MYLDQIHIACYPLLSPPPFPMSLFLFPKSPLHVMCREYVCVCMCMCTCMYVYVLFTGSWMRTCLQSMCALPVCTPLKYISVLLNQPWAVCKSSRMCGPHKFLPIPWQGPNRPNLWKSWVHNCGFYELKSSTAMTCLEVSVPHPYPFFLLLTSVPSVRFPDPYKGINDISIMAGQSSGSFFIFWPCMRNFYSASSFWDFGVHSLYHTCIQSIDNQAV